MSTNVRPSVYHMVYVSPFITVCLGPIRREYVGLEVTKPGLGISDKVILKGQSSLFSYRDYLACGKCSKSRYDAF